MCAHHLVQGAVQKASSSRPPRKPARRRQTRRRARRRRRRRGVRPAHLQDAAPAKTAPPPQKQTKSAPAKTPSDWARLVGPALVARGGASISADALEKKKNAAFLFAADWCKPCRDFVPKLVQILRARQAQGRRQARDPVGLRVAQPRGLRRT